MKLVSWNVNGIRAAWNHGLSSFMDTCRADIYCFQEIKANEPFYPAVPAGYYAYWSFCSSRKGYSGTVCLTRWKPMHYRYGFGNHLFDSEGRIITLEFPDFFLVNCYVPNSQRSAARHDYREGWDALLLAYLREIIAKKPAVVCGDFNVAVSDDDIYAENKWAGADGFQSTERESLLAILGSGFVDTYRLIHPEETGKYSWWSNRWSKRKENRGWRLDYFLVTENIKGLVLESCMLTDVMGSDHCPVILEIGLPEQDESLETPKSAKAYTFSDLLSMQRSNLPFDHIKRMDMGDIWEGIDWDACGKRLETMQMALAKSAYSHNPRLIRKWQETIVCSLEAKVLAVRHVCSASAGSGVDCIKWATPHEKMSAALSLTPEGYHAMPSRLLLVRSKNGKQRRIHIETYYDRAMQTLYAYALDPVAESWGDRKSFAFRKGRSTYDADAYIRSGCSGKDAPEWAFIGDVEKCYEHVSHGWLLGHIPMAKNILGEFIKSGYVFAGGLFPADAGIGIGLALSPILANMALDGLQGYIFAQLCQEGTTDYANGNLIRYADDLFVTARSREDAERIRKAVSDFLEERGLALSKEKSHIVRISDGFEFMSRTYYKRGDSLYCSPSQEAVERFMSDLRDTVENYSGSQKTLIDKLNRKISGFASYHKVGEADNAFRELDVYVKALLLKLCESKHPKWSREKILEKYWYMDAEGRYCYSLPDKRETRVRFLADTLYAAYRPVKVGFNPYIDLDYMEWRTKRRAVMNATGIYRAIWNRQEGKCFFCGRKMLRDDEKSIVEIDGSKNRYARRNAYVHTRCMDCSVEYIDTDILPSSVSDIMDLLKALEGGRKPASGKYLALSQFFLASKSSSVTLTFREIENIIGGPLGMTALRKEFWYRTGFGCISQCWLDNGYEIRRLHLEGTRRRVVFRLSSESKNTASVEIPEVIRYGRVPGEAKYELENYFGYILKKYGL